MSGARSILRSDSKHSLFFLRGSFFPLLVGMLLGGVWGLWDANAQTDGFSLRSVDRPVRVSVDPAYQWYETAEETVLTQFSTQMTATVPIGQRVTVQGRMGYAEMDGENLAEVRGLTDAVGRLTYAQPVGEGSVVFAIGVNTPTGKQELAADELSTTQQVSQNYYDFRVSSYSRGLSVDPRVTWAFPLGDKLAAGIGATYEHQRGFRPSAEMEETYVPGDGAGASGGVDYKITPQSALGIDVSFRRYGTDRTGDLDRFDAGNRVVGTVRYLFRDNFSTIRILARYANWEQSEFGFKLQEPRRSQVIPSHGMVMTSYQTRLTERIWLSSRVSGHLYDETVQADEKMFGRLYVSPSLQVGDRLTFSPHGTATYGSYVAFGGGLRVTGQF